MKIKEGFILRQVADTWTVLSFGAANVDFNGMLTLNDSGALLWKTLEQGADAEALADALLAEYEVSREIALQDVGEFLEKLEKAGCVEP